MAKGPRAQYVHVLLEPQLLRFELTAGQSFETLGAAAGLTGTPATQIARSLAMTATATVLLSLVVLSILLTVMIAGVRLVATRGGRKAPNTFAPDGSDVSPFAYRVSRAHANCYENLPLSGAVFLYAIATAQTAITDPTVMWFLYARIAQALVHIASTSIPAVFLRFAFYLVQVVLLLYYIYQFLTA